VGKLYSASTLVLFLSTSCSWDGGSRASAQLETEHSITFLKHSPGAVESELRRFGPALFGPASGRDDQSQPDRRRGDGQ
jgi:hypothetical protein